LHTFLARFDASRALAPVDARIGVDPEYNDNLFLVNFDAFDQGTDDLPLRVEFDRAQAVVDGRRKLFQTIDHQKQLVLP